MGFFNHQYALNRIIANDRWAQSHGAGSQKRPSYLGVGHLYIAFVAALRAKMAVCLGSGGGFVPRCMRQAQRDIGIAKESTTILVDAGIRDCKWGSPDYYAENGDLKSTPFTRQFADVHIVRMRTDAFARIYPDNFGIPINYLHIDADHSYAGVVSDLKHYLPLMGRRNIITLHDSNDAQAPRAGIYRIVREIGAAGMFRADDERGHHLQVVDFPFLWNGLAVMRLVV